MIKCPFCGSEATFNARHDSDWGGGNSFTPLASDNSSYDNTWVKDNIDDINIDIETNYCAACESFGDFEEIHLLWQRLLA